MADSLLQFARLLQSDSKVGVRVSVFRIDPHRFLPLPHRFRHAVEPHEGKSHVVMRLRAIGIHPQRLLVMLDGFLKLAGSLRNDPQMAMRIG